MRPMGRRIASFAEEEYRKIFEARIRPENFGRFFLLTDCFLKSNRV